MKQKPEDKPFTPSMRFMALIIPTEANIVSAYATQLGMVSTPHNPQKQLMLDLLAYINHTMIRISIRKRTAGERSIISSMVPIYNIISIADISMNVLALLKMVGEMHRPIVIPKKTANPPMTGTGLRCNFLALGLSTRFFIIEILSTFGCIHNVPMKAKSAVSNIC